jgi:hypothetical protein
VHYAIDPELLEQYLVDRHRAPDGCVDLSPVMSILEGLLRTAPDDDAYLRAAAPTLVARLASLALQVSDPREHLYRSLAQGIIVTSMMRALNFACQYDTPGQAFAQIFDPRWHARLAEELKSVPYHQCELGAPHTDTLVLDLAGCPTLAAALVTEFYEPEGRADPEDGGLRPPLDLTREIGEIQLVHLSELDLGPTPKDYEDSDWPDWQDNYEPPRD